MASDHEDEEYDDFVCDECFCYIDEEQAEENDGVCWDCAKAVKTHSLVRSLSLPSNYEVREVRGSHGRPCSDCGKCNWVPGDLFVCDNVNHRGTDKYCLECAQCRDWDEECRKDDGYYVPSESLSDMEHFYNLKCHKGPLPVTGGISKAMITPNLRLMSRNCERYHPNGRKCQGTLQSHTKEDFRHATCSVCRLPFETNSEKHDTEPDSALRSNKRQRT